MSDRDEIEHKKELDRKELENELKFQKELDKKKESKK